MSSEQKQLPQYQSHKKVWALKIKSAKYAAGNRVAPPDTDTDGGMILEFEDDGYAPRRVERDYVNKHKPQPGGYFVVYEDGYQSWSPAKAFEDGYSKI